MRLDELERREGDDITVEWRSFLLRPNPEERSRDQFRDYTMSWARPAGMEPAASFTHPWQGDAPPSSSGPSAVAGKVAASFGGDAERRFHRALLEAYFTHNRTVSDTDVLFDVAAAVDLDPAEFSERYHDQYRPLLREVYDEHNLAINSGVTGVPAVVVGDRYLVPGAVDVEVYQEVIEQVRAGDDQAE